MKQPLFACLSFVQRWLLIFKLKHLLLHFPYLSKSSDQQLTVGFRHPYIRAYSIRTILWVTLLVSKINVFRQLTAPHQPLTFTVGCMSRLVEVAQTTMKTDLRCKHCRKKIQKENSSNFHSSVYKKKKSTFELELIKAIYRFLFNSSTGVLFLSLLFVSRYPIAQQKHNFIFMSLNVSCAAMNASLPCCTNCNSRGIYGCENKMTVRPFNVKYK